MSFNIFYNRIDPEILKNEFLMIYYKNMFNNGLFGNLGLFDEKCQCTFNKDEFNGAYQLLVKMAQNNIHRFQYKFGNGLIQETNTGYIINVSGICQPINFQNFYLNDIHFSDTFYLSNQYPYKITNYIAHYY